MIRHAPRMTPELRRILALPRVPAQDGKRLAAMWRLCLRTPQGRQSLRPVQGIALEAVYTCGGAYVSASVGAGKTLIAYLIFAIRESTRGVYVAPAGLLRDVHRMWREYADHWIGPPRPPRLVSYEELDRVGGETLLADADPDVLVLDESHSVRRWQRTATRRIHRALDDRPDTTVVCMTATPGRVSILDHWHQLVWALGDRAPVPRSREEASVWAAALDHSGRDHAGAGVLATLGGQGKTKVARARSWYRERFATAPGVVLDTRDSCDTRLVIRQILPPADPDLEAVFEQFRKEFITPGGETISDPLEAYRLELELGAGYYGIWDPAPPKAWLVARKAWRDFARTRIEHSQRARRPLDTEAQVARMHPDAPALLAWRAVRDTYRVQPRPVWCSASVVQWAAQWARDNAPCLVWAWGVPTCQALQRATGLRWYGRKGCDEAGRFIGDADPRQSAIVSGQANLQGRNLQGWHRALYLQPPQSANWLEQAFGRMHRSGQTRDVEINVAITSARVSDGFESAIAESRFGRETWSANQKILRSQIVRAMSPVGTYRWC